MCVIWCSVRVCKIRNDIQYSRHYSATLHKHRIYAIWELRPRIMCCFCCMLAAPRSVDSLGGPISSICPPKNGQFDRRNRMRSTTSRIYGSPGGGRQTSATVLLLMRPLCTVVVTNLNQSSAHARSHPIGAHSSVHTTTTPHKLSTTIKFSRTSISTTTNEISQCR